MNDTFSELEFVNFTEERVSRTEISKIYSAISISFNGKFLFPQTPRAIYSVQSSYRVK